MFWFLIFCFILYNKLNSQYALLVFDKVMKELLKLVQLCLFKLNVF